MKPFAGNGGRASELVGAMLNVQLDRIDDVVGSMRAQKKTVVAETARLDNLGLKLSPMNSPDYDCAAHIMYLLPTAEQARRFVDVYPVVIAGKTGRHTYTEWDQVLMGIGAAHPAMNPYTHPDNAACRRTYSKDMCARSLDILNRTVMVPTNPVHTDEDTAAVIHNIEVAAKVAFGDMSADDATIRPTGDLDPQKFDMSAE
jgi:hypothetical protein